MTQAIPCISPALTKRSRENNAITWVKRGIYAYFWLLIFEGGLRKWIFPQFATPLLIVRDPVVLFIYWQALRSNRLKSPDFVPVIAIGIGVTMLSVAQVALGVNDIVTALFGLRSYCLHLPLIFVMKQVLTVRDIKKIGRWVLLIALPMAALMMVQFRASDTSWVNKGADEDSGQISFTGEHVRAAGTFSFSVGTSDFFPLVSALLLFAIAERGCGKLLVGMAAVGNVLAIPTSGSRTLVFLTAVVVCSAVLVNIGNIRSFVRLSRALAVLIVVGLLVSQTPIFQDSLEALETRWNDANEYDGKDQGLQGVLTTRVLEPLILPFRGAHEVAWLGQGIGLGSTAVAAMKTGSRGFSLSESEWPRVFEEFGPIFGVVFMGFRMWLCLSLVIAGLRSFRRGSYLSMLFAAVATPQLAFNNMEQATNLGFMVLGAGLCMASANVTRQSVVASSKRPLGGSQYAGRLSPLRPVDCP